MATSAPVLPKIPTKIPQLARPAASQPTARPSRGRARSRRRERPGGLPRRDVREAIRGDGRVVLELQWGITVYPARQEGAWRIDASVQSACWLALMA